MHVSSALWITAADMHKGGDSICQDMKLRGLQNMQKSMNGIVYSIINNIFFPSYS